MIAVAEPDIAPAATTDDDLIHIVCCDPDRAECGQDVSDAEWAVRSTPDRRCVVCVDINSGPHACCPEESIGHAADMVILDEPHGGIL